MIVTTSMRSFTVQMFNHVTVMSLHSLSTILIPSWQPSIYNIATYEDPNLSCTWLNYDRYAFSSDDVGEPGVQYSLSTAQKACAEFGKNKCNAVVGDASHCNVGPCGGPTWHPSFIVGEPTEDPAMFTVLMSDCSMWQKWPSYYLYGNSLNGEWYTTLAAAQQSCYQHGPLCNAVKRKRSKYYLMQSQDIPSKKSGSWADYWVKLAATN